MTVAAGLAAAGFGLNAASAYVQYQGARDQAKAGIAAARIRQEQLTSEAATAALQARQQESERQRRAGLAVSSGIAGATAGGFDYWMSPTAASFETENARLVDTDISNIRLLGAAQARKYALEGRSAQLSENMWTAQRSNAWIGPTLSLLGSAASAGSMMSFGGAGASAPASTSSMSSLGRAAGPV